MEMLVIKTTLQEEAGIVDEIICRLRDSNIISMTEISKQVLGLTMVVKDNQSHPGIFRDGILFTFLKTIK